MEGNGVVLHGHVVDVDVLPCPQALSSKNGGRGESLVTCAGKVVDFRCLALAVPIRLQNETTCTHDILSTQQNIVNSKMNL